MKNIYGIRNVFYFGASPRAMGLLAFSPLPEKLQL